MNGLLPLVSAALMLARDVRGDGALRRWRWRCVALWSAPPLYFAITRLSARIHGHAAASKEAESELYSRRRDHDRRGEAGAGLRPRGSARSRSSARGSEKSLALSLRLYSTETLFILIVESLLAAGTARLVWLGATPGDGGRSSRSAGSRSSSPT